MQGKRAGYRTVALMLPCPAVDGAIHAAAGPDLLDECRTLDGADTGETKLTAGYRLPAKHIAHTVGPIYRSSGSKAESERLLRSCYRSTLNLCVENDIRTVAFSGISTGMCVYLSLLLVGDVEVRRQRAARARSRPGRRAARASPFHH